MAMARRVLVTGGAGFIGSHVVDRLIAAGHAVRVLDSLEPQSHGPARERPAHLHAGVELVIGDVRDRAVVTRCVEGIEVVLHLAAAVGLAQSMYEIERFVDVNARGTAVLLEEIVAKGSQVEKVVVASTMSLYGEGRCTCATCGAFHPRLRSEAQLAKKDFAVHCPRCGEPASPSPTGEDAPVVPTTVYAVTKRDQEDLVMSVGPAYGIAVSALRLFNVYGPRQSLSNPYTGVAAIFSSRLLAQQPPIVFEDGLQTRDFTHVDDVADAFVQAASDPRANGKVLNVGAGRAFTLLELGKLLARDIGVEWSPTITHSFRKGDIRHCTADTSELERTLGLSPRVRFEDGVKDLVAWVRTQHAVDRVDRAMSELHEHGLLT